MIGSRWKPFYFLLPILAALPFGFLLGFINVIVPFILISVLILFAASAGYGEAVYECLRLSGVKNRIIYTAFGLFIGLLVYYCHLAGSMYLAYNIHADKDTPPLSIVRAAMPDSVIWYIKTTAATNVVSRAGRKSSEISNSLLNYFYHFADFAAIVFTLCAASGGYRQQIKREQIQ